MVSGIRFGVVPLEVVDADGKVVSLEDTKLARHSPGQYVLSFDQWLSLTSRIWAPPKPATDEADAEDRQARRLKR